MNKNAVGLGLGLFAALVHLVWVILVATDLAGKWLDFVTGMHFVKLSYAIDPINWIKAIGLIVLAFVVGYVVGWLATALCALGQKGKKK